MSEWFYLTISFSATIISFCLQSFSASGSFPVSWLFESCGPSTGTSSSAAVLPVNIQGWFPLGLTGFISLQSKGLSRVFSSTTVQKHHSFGGQPSLWSNSHIHTWLLEKPSVQFSCSVTSDSLQLHGLQHARPPCPSPTPGVYSNSCPLSQWCHSTISSSVIPFSSCLQSFPAPGSFQMSQFFTSGGQSIGVSASASVLPLYIQDLFPLGWIGWISLHFPRDFQESFPTPQFKSINFSVLSFLHSPTLTSIHDYWKNCSFDYMDLFFGKVISLLFNTLSRLVIGFLPRRKPLLISRLLSPSTVILEPPKIKSVSVSMVPPSICCEVMGLDKWSSFFKCWVLSQRSHSPLSPSSGGSLVCHAVYDSP